MYNKVEIGKITFKIRFLQFLPLNSPKTWIPMSKSSFRKPAARIPRRVRYKSNTHPAFVDTGQTCLTDFSARVALMSDSDC